MQKQDNIKIYAQEKSMKKPLILIVENDLKLRATIAEVLASHGYLTEIANDEVTALNILAREQVGLVISELTLALANDGIILLKKTKMLYPNLPVLIITAYAGIENAVIAMQAGAINYLVKPFVPENLINLVQRYFVSILTVPEQLVAESSGMKKVLHMAKRVAPTMVTVLLTGASGTGKEVIAKYIHKCSTVNQGPFVAINCAAIPDNMLEALLFGYEKGAFTGAYNASQGKFELAQHGTLLLDEITEMPLGLQAKLLRVLQEKEVERLGGKKTISLNVRIIAASNKNLREEVIKKNFREDLYFRLNVFPITIPPLAARKADILPLAKKIIALQAGDDGGKVPHLSQEAAEYLLQRKWFGNVRELENVIQRAMVLKTSDQIQLDDLSFIDLDEVIMVNEKESAENNLEDKLREQEYEIILEVLQKYSGQREATAKELGVSSRTLRYKLAQMKELGIRVPKYGNK